MCDGARSRRARPVRLCGSLVAVFLILSMLAALPGSASAKGWGNLKDKDVERFFEKAGENVNKLQDLRFKDLEEAFWAAASIAKMRGLGVINGYDGNIFMPNRPVTQSEALAMMVRAFGKEDEARQLAERFGLLYGAMDASGGRAQEGQVQEGEIGGESSAFVSGGITLPGVPTVSRWALGYILVAVQEGWVKLSECYPEKPATRVWVSVVMVRALGHEAEAQSKMDSTLPFADRAAVPKEYIGYVAEAVDMGLFKGYDDVTFRPNQPVTRAEMATLLDRYLGAELPADTPYLVSGEVQAISSSGITVKTSSGSQVTYSISGDALILIDREIAKSTDIHVGDVVEVLSNGSGVALLITVKSRSVQLPVIQEVLGRIVGVANPPALTLAIEGQQERTITLADDCKVFIGGSAARFSQLLLEDLVKVTISQGKAIRIDLVSRGVNSQVVTGVVYSINLSSTGTTIVLKQATTQLTVKLAANVSIMYGSTLLRPTDLRIGDQVEATLQNQEVITLKVTARGQVI